MQSELTGMIPYYIFIKKSKKGSSNRFALFLYLKLTRSTKVPIKIKSTATIRDNSGGYIAINIPHKINIAPKIIITIPLIYNKEITLYGATSQVYLEIDHGCVLGAGC
ncbi:MAG: hypothetical protein HQ594_03435 [Candidatus Omnitrophica bacterium]|nr:hypothetical protein [Candidatus Omnitrophota bacterium]